MYQSQGAQKQVFLDVKVSENALLCSVDSWPIKNNVVIVNETSVHCC
jgi:hypothetical protein